MATSRSRYSLRVPTVEIMDSPCWWYGCFAHEPTAHALRTLGKCPDQIAVCHGMSQSNYHNLNTSHWIHLLYFSFIHHTYLCFQDHINDLTVGGYPGMLEFLELYECRSSHFFLCLLYSKIRWICPCNISECFAYERNYSGSVIEIQNKI